MFQLFDLKNNDAETPARPNKKEKKDGRKSKDS